MKRVLFLLALVSTFATAAGTVVYTDQHHPPSGVTPDVRIVYLDAPERWQQQQFGELSSDPRLAARQVQQVLNSTDWPHRQKELAEHYQGMLEAYQLGLAKYPAVVFDNRDVVYGTVDVPEAIALRRGKIR